MTEFLSNTQPAKYPDTTAAEMDACSAFILSLDKNFIVPEIKSLDKVPNYDGYVEVASAERIPIGKIEVQLKKLDDNALNPPKYQCPLKFLSYCRNSYIPVMLIGVDLKNMVIYWIHMTHEVINSLCCKDGAQTVSIKFPAENWFSKKDNLSYIEAWRNIVLEQKKKLVEYAVLEKSYAEVRAQYQTLLDKSEQSIGLSKEEFRKIHIFLDALNGHLDRNFTCLKTLFFGNAWKIGLAYENYTPKNIHYVLYPIEIERNDVQIKSLNKALRERLEKEGLSFTHNWPNVIEQEPKKAALKVIDSLFKQMLKYAGVPYVNEVLATEEIYASLDRSGLKNLEKASLRDIRKGKINNPEKLEGLIGFLESKGLREIERINVKPSGQNKGPFVWSHWSLLDIQKSVENTYKYFPDVYDDTISNCFPGLAKDYKFFNGFNLLLVSVFCNEKEVPCIDYYYLDSSESKDKRILVYDLSNFPFKKGDLNFDSRVTIDDKQYVLKSWAKSILRFPFADLPIYYLLASKIEQDIGGHLRRLIDQQ